MSDEKNKLKHDMLNCLAVIKANADLLAMEKATEEIAEDMRSAIEELEHKMVLMLGI